MSLFQRRRGECFVTDVVLVQGGRVTSQARGRRALDVAARRCRGPRRARLGGLPGLCTAIFDTGTGLGRSIREGVKDVPFRMYPPAKAARVMLDGMRRNRAVIVFPLHMKAMLWAHRLAPWLGRTIARRRVAAGVPPGDSRRGAAGKRGIRSRSIAAPCARGEPRGRARPTRSLKPQPLRVLVTRSGAVPPGRVDRQALSGLENSAWTD